MMLSDIWIVVSESNSIPIRLAKPMNSFARSYGVVRMRPSQHACGPRGPVMILHPTDRRKVGRKSRSGVTAGRGSGVHGSRFNNINEGAARARARRQESRPRSPSRFSSPPHRHSLSLEEIKPEL